MKCILCRMNPCKKVNCLKEPKNPCCWLVKTVKRWKNNKPNNSPRGKNQTIRPDARVCILYKKNEDLVEFIESLGIDERRDLYRGHPSIYQMPNGAKVELGVLLLHDLIDEIGNILSYQLLYKNSYLTITDQITERDLDYEKYSKLSGVSRILELERKGRFITKGQIINISPEDQSDQYAPASCDFYNLKPISEVDLNPTLRFWS